MAVTSRGNVQSNDPQYKFVHFQVPAAADGTRPAFPLCCNGSWHLRWSSAPADVDCPACLLKMNETTAETDAQDTTSN